MSWLKQNAEAVEAGAAVVITGRCIVENDDFWVLAHNIFVFMDYFVIAQGFVACEATMGFHRCWGDV